MHTECRATHPACPAPRAAQSSHRATYRRFESRITRSISRRMSCASHSALRISHFAFRTQRVTPATHLIHNHRLCSHCANMKNP
ncbi:hypothetical protein AQ477_16860 [Burkholderia thailandensis]|nr:hypothetical protein AQ477_16860 [Burkholderia thailandensis]